MFGIRVKLLLAFGGLLVILLVVGYLSRVSLQRYSGTLDRIFRENYDSVLYAEGMKEAVDGLDDAATQAVYGTQVESGRTPAQFITEFETNLHREEGNITLTGEGELAAEIRRLWDGSPSSAGYRKVFTQLQDQSLSDSDRRTLYRQKLLPLAARLKADVQKVSDINVQNMGFANGQVKDSARVAERSLYVLVGAGIVMGLIFLSVISRSILRQLGAVTASAKEIEQGNLDLIVPVTSRDEIGQLAATFNQMASRLRDLRRTDRAKLIRTQRTTELALGSLPDGVAIVSPDGRVEIANDAAQKLFGLLPNLSIAEGPATSLGALYRQAAAERRTIQAKGYDAAIQIFNGQERFFLPTAVPIIDADRNLAGVTLVLADVTNLRKLDEMKSGLLSVVSHELKTPLTSIRMATHLLLEERVGTLNPKQNELLAAAKEDADRLYEIIENLLDMGRIESGRSLFHFQAVAPESLLRDAVDELQAAYRDKKVSLETDVPADVPRVRADADRVRHVFSNLLGNALRYTPSGGHVKIVVTPEDRDVRFAVTDTGVGIDAQSLPHIFERFYRVPGQTDRTGVGLGLAIAKEIVEAHGGSIGAKSTPGAGSTFFFTLARADEAALSHSVQT